MEMNSLIAVRPWMERIIRDIKKDIKTDHLPHDKTFYKTHFGNRPLSLLTQEEIVRVYEQELLAGNETLQEWVVNRWVFKHGDIYRHFAERLSAIHPNFQEIKSLTDAESEQVLAGAAESFGAVDTYIFCQLNGVVLSSSVLDRLQQAATQETEQQQVKEEEMSVKESLEQLMSRHERETNRLKEKYEDKLAGVQRKYTTDVEALKKQIRALQKQS